MYKKQYDYLIVGAGLFGQSNIVFGGRMGSYKYLNMDETIEISLKVVEDLLKTTDL